MRLEWLVAIGFMLTGSVIDIKKKELPLALLVLFGLAAAVCTGITGEKEWRDILYSFIPGAALLALGMCTRESIGYGDGLVVLILGLLTGLKGCLVIVSIGFVVSSVFAMVLLVFRKVKGKSRLPFLPFLTIGLGVMLLAEEGLQTGGSLFYR